MKNRSLASARDDRAALIPSAARNLLSITSTLRSLLPDNYGLWTDNSQNGSPGGAVNALVRLGSSRLSIQRSKSIATESQCARSSSLRVACFAHDAALGRSSAILSSAIDRTSGDAS